MRVTNVIGGLVTLVVAIAIDYSLLVPIYDWINSNATGQAQMLLLLSVTFFFLFITFGLPVMIAMEDDKGTTIAA